ncbi:MAG TPA: Tol-Pal system beta propeller repeat protein TolB [Burkholderiaceae bacterium]|nr:Tol-Pal system beta propeller repeat protein TolB [Burkholderiaceae bacterium]
MRRRLIAAASLAAATPLSRAQMRIDVTGVGATQLPIVIGGFGGDGRAPIDVAAVVRSDLFRSGAFRILEAAQPITETTSIDFASLQARGAETVLGGSVARLADGRYDVRYRLHDVVRQNVLASESLLAQEADLRLVGHRIADSIYEKLTGEKGIFSTRIAFVTLQGTRYRLNVSDWDGENQQTMLNSPEPIISPKWAPDGSRLAYVSFEAKKPVVYVHELATGQRQAVANFRGSNSAPAWAPDGKRLAVALTLEGLSQIYMIGADGSNQRRLTSSNAIDTEPHFSPDGRFIYFTSDRGGTPQIYRMTADGSDATRVTFGSPYNVSPRVSPDGRLLAFVTRRDNRFLIALKDLSVASSEETLLTAGGRDESPSFAPNGRWIMYATQIGGRDTLMATTVDGRVRQRLTSNNDIREPAWGPYLS